MIKPWMKGIHRKGLNMNVVEKSGFDLLLQERGYEAVETLLKRIRDEYPIDWSRRPHYQELLNHVQSKVGA